MELRAAAHISGDRAMTEAIERAFEQGLDLHNITASRMTGKDPAAVTDEERKGAKAVNFGAIYGQGAAGLVQAAWAQWGLVLDQVEAEAWLQAFESAYYGFAQWRRDHYQRCEARHHIVIGKDADRGIGRIFPKSRVPEGASYYTRCCNLPVQGACADASMLALAYVDDRLFEAGIEGGPVAWLHDEIVLEVPRGSGRTRSRDPQAIDDRRFLRDVPRRADSTGWSSRTSARAGARRRDEPSRPAGRLFAPPRPAARPRLCALWWPDRLPETNLASLSNLQIWLHRNSSSPRPPWSKVEPTPGRRMAIAGAVPMIPYRRRQSPHSGMDTVTSRS